MLIRYKIVVIQYIYVCSVVSDSVTPWTVAYQAPLSMGFSGKNTGVGGVPFPSPEDLPDPGIEPGSPALQAVSLPNELRRKPSNLGAEIKDRIFYELTS